jgi:hypothetical protein
MLSSALHTWLQVRSLPLIFACLYHTMKDPRIQGQFFKLLRSPGYAVLVEKVGLFLEKIGLFWKKPYFYSDCQVLVVCRKSTPTFSKVARLFNHTGYTQYVLKKLGLFHQLKRLHCCDCLLLLICEDILLLSEVHNCRLLFKSDLVWKCYTLSARLTIGSSFKDSLSKDCEQNFLLYITSEQIAISDYYI